MNARVIVVSILLGFGWVPSASASHCVEVVVQATVCVTAGGVTSCTTEFYTDDYWCTGGGTGGSGGGGDGLSGGGGGGGGTVSNPADINENGTLDHWKSVVNTQDPCSDNFDLNDQLGTDFGGNNTTRPGHTGVDIQADLNDPVAAVRDGEISFVGWQNPNLPGKGCGFHIRIIHPNGDTSIYCHLVEDSNTFGEGDAVRAGTVIGGANSTGNSSGHHVHVSYNSSDTGQREPYYEFTDTPPTAEDFDANGC